MISVVSGPAQLALIDAAAQAGVRRFAPAEFEGPAALRPQSDALDRGKRSALERLRYYETRGMQYTSFVCGILYERFGPGGMIASMIGVRSGIGAEGDYLMNIGQRKAQIPHGTNGQPATISLTSADDVGKFVAAAISLQQWPPELRMRGDRMNVSRLVHIAETIRGTSTCPNTSLFYRLTVARNRFRESPTQHSKHAVSPPARALHRSHTRPIASNFPNRHCQRTLRLCDSESQHYG